MFEKLFRKRIEAIRKDAYNAGLAKGYELGYAMGRSSRTNRGFVIGPQATRLDEELQAILKEKGVL